MNNPVLDYMIMRDVGWMCKMAGKWRTALSIGSPILSAAGIGYGEYMRRKSKKMEDKRELMAALNDTLERRRLSKLYEMAGIQAPTSPLAVSKEVSPQYQEMMQKIYGGIQHKGASIKKAISLGGLSKFVRSKKLPIATPKGLNASPKRLISIQKSPVHRQSKVV